MSFEDATKKEAWFFRELLRRRYDEILARACGMGCFRTELVDKYEKFATKSFVTDQQVILDGAEQPGQRLTLAQQGAHGERPAVATRVFLDVNKEMDHMKDDEDGWGWKADEERYDEPECQRKFLLKLLLKDPL